MKNIISSFIILILLPVFVTAADYYAASDGSGTVCSFQSPCKVSSFYPKMSPGDTLFLKDGIYRGADSMIYPPADYDTTNKCKSYGGGTAQEPITIKALNEGKVIIDGQDARRPVYLLCQNYFIIEGINAHSSSSGVFEIYYGSNNIMRRCVGWDAIDGNRNIFGIHYGDASHNLYEDCAGFGVSRKVFSPSGAGVNNTFRRVFARLEKNTWGGQIGITASYNTNDNIVENAIVTVDGILSAESMPNNNAFWYLGDDRATDENNKVLGSICYRTKDQQISESPLAVFRSIGRKKTVRDILVYVEDPEPSTGGQLKFTGMVNDKLSEYFDAKYLTIIGGPGSKFWLTSTGKATHIIASDATWDRSTYVDTAVYSYSSTYRPDYVMFHNNDLDYNYKPDHVINQDPNLIGRCGNILQYGCSARPEVGGQPVGAQIQCRYENGVLTEKPLWPWPMNERIRVATCIYETGLSQTQCEQDKTKGLDLTKTIFELGGGSIPDFGSINPIVCPEGQISNCEDLGGVCCLGSQICSVQTQSTSECPKCCIGECLIAEANSFLPDIVVEAEYGSINSPMQSGIDSSADNGKYIYSSESFQGSADFSFNISQPGEYFLKVKIMTPDTKTSHDSFYVGLKGQAISNNEYYTYDSIQTDIWAWDDVSLRGDKGNHTYAEFDPMVWTLSAGQHTFTIFGREKDTRLDQLILNRVTVTQCGSADSDTSGDVDIDELIIYINEWKTGTVGISEIMDAVGKWKNGC